VVLAAALDRAGTVVCQPVDRFELELPLAAHSPVAALLGRLGAVLLEVASTAGYAHLVGTVASVRVPALAGAIPDLTGGQGILVSRFDHYTPVVSGTPPVRTRHGPDPRDRAGWFRAVPR